MSEKVGDNIKPVDTAETAGKTELGYPIIRKCVSAHNLERYFEQITDYCVTLDEPLFIEKDGKLDNVLMSTRYYREMGFDEVHPLPTDEEIAAALAESGDER